MRPSLKARAHKSLRFSPSEDEEAVVIKVLIVLKSASSINSRNATRMGEILSGGVVIAVGRLMSMLGGAQVLFFGLLWCFLLLGPMLYLQKLIPYP